MTQYPFADATKIALRIAEIEDISIFADMNKEELRNKYPRVNFSADFFIDMMQQGYFDMWQLRRMFHLNIFYPEDLIHLSADQEILLIANDNKIKKKIALVKKCMKCY